MHVSRILVLFVAALLLAGCAISPPSSNFSDLAEQYPHAGLTDLPEHAPKPPSGELTLAEAVEQALWHNPKMQAIMADFDVAAADVVAASEFANPRLSAGVFFPESGGRNEYDLGLSWGISGLLLRSSRQTMAQAHFQEQRLKLAERISALIHHTQQAYLQAVAAEQNYQLQGLRTRSAQTAMTLSERFYQAGNLTELDRHTYRIKAAEQDSALTQARYERDMAWIALAAAMGQVAAPDQERDWHIPQALPQPLPELADVLSYQQQAEQQRLDLRALDYALEGVTEAVALTERYRWLGDVRPGLGYERKHSGTRLYGASLSIALPVFNQNQSGMARAEAKVARVQAARAQLDLAIATDIQAQHEKTQSLAQRFEIHQARLESAHQQVVLEQTAQVNFMLDDVFSLFAPRDAQIEHWQTQNQLLGDYWRSVLHLHYLAGQTALPEAIDASDRFEPLQSQAVEGHDHHHGHHEHNHDDHSHH